MLYTFFARWRVLPKTPSLYLRPKLGSIWNCRSSNSKHQARNLGAKGVGALYCEIDAEPLDRYRPGGYHPTHLGDTFKDGRYKVIHKLGWGGYGTVWLARDFIQSRHVAIKMLVSEQSHSSQEARVLKHLSQGSTTHPGKQHIVRLLDQFDHTGPNGTHQCLVFETLGPTVVSEAESYKSYRLPGKIVWEVLRQITQALAYVHANGITHGDLHPGNIVFANTPSYDSDTELLNDMGKPETSDILPFGGYHLTAHIPSYLVQPASFPLVAKDVKGWQVKLIDFGEAFFVGQPAPQIHCPLVFRAPEVVLTSQWNHRIDIWSLGCTIFELVVGYPPFCDFLPNKDGLIREWITMLGDLPEEWREYVPLIPASDKPDPKPINLRDWLHETYFEDDKKQYFSRADIDTLATLLLQMLQYRPADRPPASELLHHPWFQRNPLIP